MPLRPARCYTNQDKPPYTRREYIQGVPPPKISKYTAGSPYIDAKWVVQLVAEKRCVARHNALEAARLMAQRYLSTVLGELKYFMKIRKYPHHVLRENKMLAFAGADRLQDGMRLAFGKPIGTAAIINPGDVIIDVYIADEKDLNHAKEALRRAGTKLPETYRVVVKSINKK